MRTQALQEGIHLKFKRAGILTKLILAVLLIYVITSLVVLRTKIQDARDAQAQLEQQALETTAVNEEMRYAIENSDDDDVIKDVARDKLGLVEPGEEVYYAG